MPSDNKPENSESTSPVREKAKDISKQAAIAMELPLVLVSAVVVGGLLGYFLDRWLHTKPLFLLVLGGIGFYAGVRDVLRRLGGSGDGIKRRWFFARCRHRAAHLLADAPCWLDGRYSGCRASRSLVG